MYRSMPKNGNLLKHQVIKIDESRTQLAVTLLRMNFLLNQYGFLCGVADDVVI